jgi:hypothetical protein
MVLTHAPGNDTQFALGTTAVQVTATDAAGNQSTGSFNVTVRDTRPPVGTITINGDALATPTPNVTVAVNFTDAVGPTRMRFSMDGGATWTAWEAYATTKSLTLPSGDGLKTVLAQVSDAAGNVGSASDSIQLVSEPPKITITPLAGGPCDLCVTYFLHYVVVSQYGIVSVSATLDGKAIANGAVIDTFYLNAGAHTIVVTATDVFGKISTQSMVFEIHPTIEGLICAVHRGVREGLIAPQQEQPLIAKLNAAIASRDRGNTTSETNQLQAEVHDLQAQDAKKIQPLFDARMIGWVQDVIIRIPAPSSIHP